MDNCLFYAYSYYYALIILITIAMLTLTRHHNTPNQSYPIPLLGMLEARLSTSSRTISTASSSSEAFSGNTSATFAGRTSNYLFFFMKRSQRMLNLFLSFSIKFLEVHSLNSSANLRNIVLSFLTIYVKATLELKTDLNSWPF